METTRRAGLAQGLVIIMIGILPMMAIVTLMPIVPALVKAFPEVGGIQTLAPLVLSAPGLCVALLSPFAGALTDRIGRRRLLLIFTTLYGVGGVLPFFLTSFEALMAGRLLLGVGEAFILTIGNTLLGDYFEKEERAKWLMWQSLVGPALGALLVAGSGRLSMISWNVPFLIYGVALGMAAFAVFAIYEPERRSAPSEPKDDPGATGAATAGFPTGLMLRLAVTTFVLSAIYFVYTLQFSLALDQMGIKKGDALGLYTAFASVGVPVGAFLYKRMAGRSTTLQFTVLFTLLGTGLIGIGLALGLQATMGFAFLQQLAAGMTIPVLVSWSLRELPERFRGRGMGWWCSAFFLGQFVSPFFVTAVRSVVGSLLTTFVVFGVVCIAIAVTNALVARHGSPAPQRRLAG